MTRTLLLALLMGGTSLAINTTIRDNDRHVTIDCTAPDDTITVRGNNNTLTLNGTCENVVIYGNNTVVRVAALGQLWTKGNNNRVTVGATAAAPRWYNTGNENQLFRARQ